VGVAFILNKELIDTTNIETTEIIPGRVPAIQIRWCNNDPLMILNIYAPNNLLQHPEFWNIIVRAWQEKNVLQPHFMMGDFNITEDPIDCTPS
jgi:exonuclease III